MRKFFTHLSVICLLFVMFAVPTTFALAAPHADPGTSVSLAVHVQETDPALPTPEDLAATLRNLGGIALLASLLVNLGKKYLPQLFPDGAAPKYSLAFNILGMAILAYLQLSGNADVIPLIDEKAGAIANAATVLLGLAGQLFFSRVAHQEVLAGLPVVGKSNSGQVAGENQVIIAESDLIEDEIG